MRHFYLYFSHLHRSDDLGVGSIRFFLDPPDALEVETKLMRSERFPTFDLFTTRTEDAEASLFLLLRSRFLLPPVRVEK